MGFQSKQLTLMSCQLYPWIFLLVYLNERSPLHSSTQHIPFLARIKKNDNHPKDKSTCKGVAETQLVSFSKYSIFNNLSVCAISRFQKMVFLKILAKSHIQTYTNKTNIFFFQSMYKNNISLFSLALFLLIFVMQTETAFNHNLNQNQSRQVKCSRSFVTNTSSFFQNTIVCIQINDVNSEKVNYLKNAKAGSRLNNRLSTKTLGNIPTHINEPIIMLINNLFIVIDINNIHDISCHTMVIWNTCLKN